MIYTKKIMTGRYDYYLYKTTKEIFGRKIKERKFKKWFARYIDDKKKHIRRYGISSPNDSEYFGCKVFKYNSIVTYKSEIVFTCKPKCKHTKPCTLNHASVLRGWVSIDLPF